MKKEIHVLVTTDGFLIVGDEKVKEYENLADSVVWKGVIKDVVGLSKLVALVVKED